MRDRRPTRPRIIRLGFGLILAGLLLGCAGTTTTTTQKPTTTEARAGVATAAASVSAVATSTAAALIALCKPEDQKCKTAITALGAIGAGTAPLPSIITPPCVPLQSGRELQPGETFCPAAGPPGPQPPPPQ